MDPVNFVCSACKHSSGFDCLAFPYPIFDGIPKSILDNNKHNKPIKGQIGDYVFEPKEKSK